MHFFFQLFVSISRYATEYARVVMDYIQNLTSSLTPLERMILIGGMIFVLPLIMGKLFEAHAIRKYRIPSKRY